MLQQAWEWPCCAGMVDILTVLVVVVTGLGRVRLGWCGSEVKRRRGLEELLLLGAGEVGVYANDGPGAGGRIKEPPVWQRADTQAVAGLAGLPKDIWRDSVLLAGPSTLARYCMRCR